jgi:hypothetical protein
MLGQDRLETATILAPGQALEPRPEPAQAPRLEPRQREQQDDGDDEGSDDGSEMALDVGVEIDDRNLPVRRRWTSRSSLARAARPELTGPGGILPRLPHHLGGRLQAMAKRVRSGGRPMSRRTAPRRPAAPPSVPRAGTSPTPPPALDGELLEPSAAAEELPRASSGHLTEDELRRSEELQAQMAAQERAAMAEQIRRRQRARAGLHELEDINAPLRVRAAHEYAYVARDVRRIVITGGVMVAILAVLAILINGFGVISI